MNELYDEEDDTHPREPKRPDFLNAYKQGMHQALFWGTVSLTFGIVSVTSFLFESDVIGLVYGVVSTIAMFITLYQIVKDI